MESNIISDAWYDESQFSKKILESEDSAVEYLGFCCQKGSILAMIAMADYLYDRGRLEESVRWMDRAESSVLTDDNISPIYLASALRRSLGSGDAQDRAMRSMAWLEKVAESGNLTVIHSLMTDHLYGLNGREKSQERFIYWVRKAANLGSLVAKRILKRYGGE